MSDRLLDRCVAGIGYAIWGEDLYLTKTPAERAELLLEEVEFILWLQDFSVGRAMRKFERSAVVAAIYMTWKRSRKDADTFWIAVREEDGHPPNVPDRVLANFLSTTSNTRVKGYRRAAIQIGNRRMFYAKCIHAWNAWRRKATTDLRYIPSADLPNVL